MVDHVQGDGAKLDGSDVSCTTTDWDASGDDGAPRDQNSDPRGRYGNTFADYKNRER